MNKTKAVRGCKALKLHLKNNSLSNGYDGENDGFIYFKNPNTGMWTFDLYNNIIYEIVSLKEYLRLQFVNEEPKILTVIKGCQKLYQYYKDNNINNLNGSHEDCYYFLDENGEWEFSLTKLNNMVIVPFEEYCLTPKTNKMKAIKGCQKLHQYFVENGIGYMDGEDDKIIYWVDGSGEWCCEDGEYTDKFHIVSFEEYFGKTTKVVEMNPTFTVDKEFILEAHKAACEGWKTKIEKKFPSLFKEESVIGKRYLPNDNSYAICLENGECSCVVLSGGIYNKECIIISEPYRSKSKDKGYNPRPNDEHNFVNVLYKNNTYMVLFNKHNVNR